VVVVVVIEKMMNNELTLFVVVGVGKQIMRNL
jgi:hypothetical protein